MRKSKFTTTGSIYLMTSGDQKFPVSWFSQTVAISWKRNFFPVCQSRVSTHASTWSPRWWVNAVSHSCSSVGPNVVLHSCANVGPMHPSKPRGFSGECLIQLVFLVALLEDDSGAKLVRTMCIQVYFYVHNKYILWYKLSVCVWILSFNSGE